MEKTKIDSYTAALKLIEMLFEKGLINSATYINIKQHTSTDMPKAA